MLVTSCYFYTLPDHLIWSTVKQLWLEWRLFLLLHLASFCFWFYKLLGGEELYRSFNNVFEHSCFGSSLQFWHNLLQRAQNVLRCTPVFPRECDSSCLWLVGIDYQLSARVTVSNDRLSPRWRFVSLLPASLTALPQSSDILQSSSPVPKSARTDGDSRF